MEIKSFFEVSFLLGSSEASHPRTMETPTAPLWKPKSSQRNALINESYVEVLLGVADQNSILMKFITDHTVGEYAA